MKFPPRSAVRSLEESIAENAEMHIFCQLKPGFLLLIYLPIEIEREDRLGNDSCTNHVVKERSYSVDCQAAVGKSENSINFRKKVGPWHSRYFCKCLVFYGGMSNLQLKQEYKMCYIVFRRSMIKPVSDTSNVEVPN